MPRGIDPHEYLRDVPTRITETTNWQVVGLTPGKWAEKALAEKGGADAVIPKAECFWTLL